MLLLYSAKKDLTVNSMLVDSLQQILTICHQDQQRRAAAARACRSPADDVNVDDSEVKIDEVQDGDASAGQPQGGDLPTTSKDVSRDAKPSSSEGSQMEPFLPLSKGSSGEMVKEVQDQTTDLTAQDPSKVGSASEAKVDAEGKVDEAEAEVMCVDVMEASQSVEVCTMPSAEGSGHQLGGPGPLKRLISGGTDSVEGIPGA